MVILLNIYYHGITQAPAVLVVPPRPPPRLRPCPGAGASLPGLRAADTSPAALVTQSGFVKLT